MAEDIARELMRELIAAGEQAAALTVFERCRQAIAQNLRATPAPATLALLALALARSGSPALPPQAPSRAPTNPSN